MVDVSDDAKVSDVFHGAQRYEKNLILGYHAVIFQNSQMTQAISTM